jgi:hypothetical protein
MLGIGGVTAPAQHVANASALRASLVGFFLAFWEHVLEDRGGLRLLLLDDPQELLDEENRERLAHALGDLLQVGAQLIVTTYDRKFADLAARLRRLRSKIDHRSVEPVTRIRPIVQTPVCVMEIARLEKARAEDPDDPVIARDYASECRLFVEARIGDIFDDAAHPASSAYTSQPTLSDHLGRLRRLISTPPIELFRSPTLKALAEHPGLAEGAAALALLNKAHHQKDHIRPQDVALVADDLVEIRKLSERAHEACRMWRRREKEERPKAHIAPLVPMKRPKVSVMVQPDLAAFTQGSSSGGSQAEPELIVDETWFDGKALFLLRCDNFGFAAPQGSAIIVEADADAVEDRRLVVARTGTRSYARRLLRSPESGMLGLSAETSNPYRRPPTVFTSETEVLLHRVVGVIIHHKAMAHPRDREEAVSLADVGVLDRIEAAYEVRDESAIPLALPRQIALGGSPISLDQFDVYRGELAALHLDDDTSVFKRVGAALPKPLSHLRQFESIGGLGESQVLAVGVPAAGFRTVVHARLIVGVLYHH